MNNELALDQKYTTDTIVMLEEKITKMSEEVAYCKAWLFLDTLAHTQETVLVDYLAEHYGTTTKLAFGEKDFRNLSEYTTATKVVKRAISMYKSNTDTKKNPTWANAALKAAKVVDEYKSN